MKILMLVPFLPNASMSGGQTRWYNLIKYMSASHEITLFSLIKDESERRFVPELEKYCKKVRVFKRPKSPWTFRNLFLTAFSFYPLLVIRNYSSKEKHAIKKELKEEKYDLIHAEAFYVMPHVPKTKIPSILVEQTIEYMVYKHYVDTEVPWILKPIYLLDILKLRFWELYFWKKTNQLVAVSSSDKKIMQKLIPGIDVDIIPNGVDAQFYVSKKAEKLSPPRVLYGVTNFEWLQNIEAVQTLIQDVWPEVHEKFPKAKLWIVGRLIPKWIVELSQKRSDIEITESIPDARDAYLKSTLMVAPIKGSGGTRLKILEAMAAGLPVISTSIGVAGLDLENGKHAIIKDKPSELAQETIRLLKNPLLAKKIGLAGQKFAKENYDWKKLVEIQDKIYKDVLS
ncbi:MAG: glycosyltransferase [Candidatus Woesebacteria bacterium]|nr:MAG: glycosyltransferase [Candidatus Woesebacteria bacterium]